MRGMLLRLQLAALLAVALFAPNHVEGDAAGHARMSGLNFQPSKLPSKQLLPPALSGKGKPSASSGRAGQHPAVPAKHRKYFKFLRARAAGLQKREPGERPSSAHLRPEVLPPVPAVPLARARLSRLSLRVLRPISRPAL